MMQTCDGGDMDQGGDQGVARSGQILVTCYRQS